MDNLIESGRLAKDPDPSTIEWARQLISLYIPQMSYTGQISDLATIFFEQPKELDEKDMKELADDNALQVLKLTQEKLRALPTFSAYYINQAVYHVRLETGVKGRKLYMPVRIATTREMHGPQLAETID